MACFASPRRQPPVKSLSFLLCANLRPLSADSDLIREASVKLFNTLRDRQTPPMLGSKEEVAFMKEGVFARRGKAWTSARTAMTPFFQGEHMRRNCECINAAVDRFVEHLDSAAAEGREIQAIDELSKMTLEAICDAAFGADLKLMNESEGPRIPGILAAARGMFQSLNFRRILALVALITAPTLLWLQERGVVLLSRAPLVMALSRCRCYLWGVIFAWLGLQRARGLASSPDAEPHPTSVGGGFRDECFSQGMQDCSAAAQTDGLGPAPLLHLLARHQDPATGAPPSDMFICAQGFNLINGGFETTALGLSYALYELSVRPDLQARIAAEANALADARRAAGAADPDFIGLDDLKSLPFTDAAFMEALRLWPPVSPMVPLNRRVTQECRLGEYTVPAGTTLMFNVYGVHRSSRYFPEPEVYRPERFMGGTPEAAQALRHFLPFGLGPRACVGVKFARTEGVVALAKLMRSFEFEMDGSRRDLDVVTSLTLLPRKGVWVRPRRRI